MPPHTSHSRHLHRLQSVDLQKAMHCSVLESPAMVLEQAAVEGDDPPEALVSASERMRALVQRIFMVTSGAPADGVARERAGCGEARRPPPTRSCCKNPVLWDAAVQHMHMMYMYMCMYMCMYMLSKSQHPGEEQSMYVPW